MSARGGIEIARMVLDRVDHEARARELVHAIGGEHEDVALLQPQRLVVDVEVRVDAERAAQVALLAATPRGGGRCVSCSSVPSRSR